MNHSKSEAWNDGYNAYLKGHGREWCPYTEDDEYFYEWHHGWGCAYEHNKE